MNKIESSIIDAYTEGSTELEFGEFRNRIIDEQVPAMTVDIIDAYRACPATEPEEPAGAVSIVDLMARVIVEDAEERFPDMYAYAVADTVAPTLVTRIRVALEAASSEDEAYNLECDADNLEGMTVLNMDDLEDVHATILRVSEFLDAVEG